MLCYGPLVSELGGRVHGAPNPVIGGGAVPPAAGSAAYDTQRSRPTRLGYNASWAIYIKVSLHSPQMQHSAIQQCNVAGVNAP